MERKIELNPSERHAYRRFLATLRKTSRKRWSDAYSLRMAAPNAVLMGSAAVERFCPITAVCFVADHKAFGAGNYRQAGRRIGLSIRLANLIAGAADRTLVECHYDTPHPSRERLLLRIRRDLLKAIGQTKKLRGEEQELRAERMSA